MRLCGLGADWFYVSEKPTTVAQYQAITQSQARNNANLPAAASPSPPQCDISLSDAIRFSRMLSELEQKAYFLLNIDLGKDYPPIPQARSGQQIYVLPDINQLKILSLTNYAPSCALWINSPWQPNDLDSERALERFAVSFNIVWDPLRLFADSVTFGELPFARYPQLGFAVVTPTQTGWNLRWQRLLNKMAANAAAQPPANPAPPEQ